MRSSLDVIEAGNPSAFGSRPKVLMKILAGCAAAAIALSTAGPAGATPFVSLQVNASAGASGNPGDSESFSLIGTTELGTSANAVVNAPITPTSNFAVGASSSGNVGLGFIGGSAGADVQSTHTGSSVFLGLFDIAGGLGSMVGEFRIDDLVLSGPAGPTVPVFLNLDLTGSLDAGGSMNSPGFDWPAGAGGSAEVNVGVTAPGLSSSGIRRYLNNNRNEESFFSSGLLAGGDELATDPFQVQVGVPFAVEVIMRLSVGASTNITHGNAFADASFSNTLSFPTNRPVFTVPDGYTVNSVSAGIVDNRFQFQSQVPEPSTLALLLIGSILVAGARQQDLVAHRLPFPARRPRRGGSARQTQRIGA